MPKGSAVVSLRLDFCSRQAAAFAVKTRHYSRSMPAGRLVCIGVWEFLLFVGALIFGRGAASNIGADAGLPQDEVCELNRVALGPHEAPTSRILSIAVRLLKKQSPGLRLIVSYADPRHGHDGRGVYAAAGWLYLGRTQAERLIVLHGKPTHARTVSSKYGTRSLEWLRANVDPHAEHLVELPKHKYAWPFDDDLRRQLAPRVQPYPKREQSTESGAPQNHQVHSSSLVDRCGGGERDIRPARSSSEVTDGR
jgi:hypothetical protein